MKRSFRTLPILALSMVLLLATAHCDAPKHAPDWMQVEETVVPVRANTTRNADILGFVHKGQVLAVERMGENWVKVRVNDSLRGWMPLNVVSPSGPPVNLNPGDVKAVLFGLLGLAAGAFLFMAVSLTLKRRRESRERAQQALADAKRRLQNKIQLLFRAPPRIHSHLEMTEVDLREFLQGIGYVANLESEPDRFMASCKTFKPNLILAGYDFRDSVEKMVETDAMLINTPVVYMHCDKVPTDGNRVRAYLEHNASERELSDAISACLKKSPEKIRYSVKPVALKGSIHTGTLMELLHFLAAVKKTGQLLVVAGAARGEVLLRKGDITKAAIQGLKGAQAAEAILNLSTGTFEFHEIDFANVSSGAKAAHPKSEDGHLNTQKVLMDWAKGKDENDHHSRP